VYCSNLQLFIKLLEKFLTAFTFSDPLFFENTTTAMFRLQAGILFYTNFFFQFTFQIEGIKNKTVHEELAKHLIFYLRLGADPTMIANILQVKKLGYKTGFRLHGPDWIEFFSDPIQSNPCERGKSALI